MRAPIAFLLLMTLAGCQLTRPGEISPQRIPGCAEVEAVGRVTPVADLTEQQLQQLTYCSSAAAAEAARATESHTDYLADMSYIGLLVSIAAVVATIIMGADAATE